MLKNLKRLKKLIVSPLLYVHGQNQILKKSQLDIGYVKMHQKNIKV